VAGVQACALPVSRFFFFFFLIFNANTSLIFISSNFTLHISSLTSVIFKNALPLPIN